MTKWNLPNIEFINVPPDLAGYAHGIMMNIVGYMKAKKKEIKKNENLGGMFVSNDQIVPHQCTFRLVHHDEEPVDKEFLRVVDIGKTADSGFPKKLFAAHLLALSSTYRNPYKQKDLLEKSVKIFPGGYDQNPEREDASIENPGNYFSWEALGNVLCDLGEIERGLDCMKEAAARWPFGAQKTAEMFREEIRKGNLPSANQDHRSKFWSELDPMKIREQKMSLK
jgi:hypothetical protein